VAAVVSGAGLLTVAVTAWYATRLWLRTFLGARRSAAAAHDPPPLMAWPVVALAVPSALLGFAALVEAFAPWLRTPEPVEWTGEYAAGVPAPEPLLDDQSLVHLGGFVLLPLAAVALGIGLAWALWRRDPAADPARALGPARAVFARGFYLDDMQDALVVRPARALARAVRRGDEGIVDGAVEGAGRGAVSLGALLGRAHRAGLPRAATAVLAGALLVGLAVTLGSAL
jgi:NADH-quinone oxidoreductase subunit L